jgi:hypothetical protein
MPVQPANDGCHGPGIELHDLETLCRVELLAVQRIDGLVKFARGRGAVGDWQRVDPGARQLGIGLSEPGGRLFGRDGECESCHVFPSGHKVSATRHYQPRMRDD